METIREIFSANDSWCEVTSAWAFSMNEVFLYLDMASEEADKHASLLLRVDLTSKTPVVATIQAIDFGALDYVASSADDHWLLVSGGFIHHIHGGNEQFYDPITDLYLRGFAKGKMEELFLFGEDGAVFSFNAGNAQKLASPLDDEMLDGHFIASDKGHVCGTGGALVSWDGQQLRAIDLGGHDEFEAVFSRDDGTLLLGVNDGTGIVFRNDEVVRIGQADGGIQAITVFQGIEYWGDDDFGIYIREGDELSEKFETEGAFKLNSTDNVMCTVVGAEVYMFDGTDWIQLHVSPSIENIVTRVPLDFTPL
ncbi:hypothetical protein [Cognatiyoonia sp. IB215182]|uniref:hypothetical protein n=1 Tax=Cognatiyoonia sp. IB215182 TaxID=3097353 RepID=UPI002A15B959|nr:hypothetical protein [Cognatiyoonia sp. IB215182]MDX8352714.1 hypothetical protein [Cognatiyoonia sp. IB215182]